MFATHLGVNLSEKFSIETNQDLNDKSMVYLFYTSVDKMDKQCSTTGLTYYEIQKVINCNNNIVTDYSVKNGHFYTAGNFISFEAQLELDILFSKIICKSINLFPKLRNKEYLFQDILNCFRDPLLLEEKSENIELLEIINKNDEKSQQKILSEFYKLQNQLDNYKLLEKERKRQAQMRRLQHEELSRLQVQEMEKEMARLQEENEELRKQLANK
jgi:hypothetical protein